MKKNLFKLSLVFVFFWLFWDMPMAKADGSVTVRLQIKTNGTSLYDDNIIVTACPEADGSATSTVNVRCAVDQTGLTDPSDWTYGGTFLNSIKGSYASDYVNNIYWGWFSNLEYGQVSMTQHILTSGEKLLLVYNTNPLKISVDNTAPYVNATSTITVEQFGLDVNWMPVWTPVASSTLVIGGTEVFNESGVYEYAPSVSGEKIVYGKKAGYVNSYNIMINGQDAQVSIEPTVNTSQPGGSVIIPPGGGSPVATVKVDLGKAVDFLISKQSADGSFGTSLQTDWAAIALASVNPNGAAAQKVKSYLLTDPNPSVGLNKVSDYARRAMTLMSLNISPYNGVKTDYVKKIVDLFDGQQFGDAALYNDDIFALLVLNKAGYGAEDEMIRKTVDFIIAKQQANGFWNGVDLTAAAVQALVPVSALNGASAALTKARNFLVNAQGADGGFGDTYATSWAMQAITSLGENSGNWQKNNNTPESYLVLSQGADGGLEKDNSYDINRVWSTAYAIPAVFNKAWFNILSSFAKENTAVIKNEPAGNSPLVLGPNLIATSTPEKLDLATSSPATASQALDQASTTAVSLTAETDNNKNKDIIKPAKSDVKTMINLPVNPKKPLPPPVLRPKVEPPKTLNINNQADQTEEMVQAAPSLANSLTPEVKGAEERPAEPNKINNKAKKVLYIAGAGTVLAGIVLILKFLGFLL